MAMHKTWSIVSGETLLLLVVLLCASPSSAQVYRSGGGSMLTGVHGDTSILPGSCRSCHRGMNMSISGEETVCLQCHGASYKRSRVVSGDYLRVGGGIDLADIEAELYKPYSHPVLTSSGIHRQYEQLPEEVVNAARHSECIDCHEPHVLEKLRPFRGIKGKRVGDFIVEVDEEYQLCYKCHAGSANLPSWASDKSLEFKTSNPSFHPVEGEGANAYVISLREPYAARKERPSDVSTISCSDCHGSDDPNGPRGPHGSNYRGLLKYNYEMEDGRPESYYAYALCYGCHDRASILGDESFAYHSLHIEGRGGGQSGTSCYTCHDAHGSSRYQYLVRFNEDVVSPNADDKLEYKADGVASRHGSCLLSCHGVEHNPKSY